jgi:hypothetical protein
MPIELRGDFDAARGLPPILSSPISHSVSKKASRRSAAVSTRRLATRLNSAPFGCRPGGEPGDMRGSGAYSFSSMLPGRRRSLSAS